MLGAGTVINPIIKIVTVIVVLGASYLFIVKPILDTTNKAFESSGIDQIGKSLQHLGPQIEREVKRSFRVTKAQGGNPQKLLKCVKRANQNVERIERCTRRF